MTQCIFLTTKCFTAFIFAKNLNVNMNTPLFLSFISEIMWFASFWILTMFVNKLIWPVSADSLFLFVNHHMQSSHRKTFKNVLATLRYVLHNRDKYTTLSEREQHDILSRILYRLTQAHLIHLVPLRWDSPCGICWVFISWGGEYSWSANTWQTTDHNYTRSVQETVTERWAVFISLNSKEPDTRW